MALRLQKTSARRPPPGGLGGPLSEQVSQLRADVEDLEKDAKSQRTEAAELRLGIQSANVRAEGLEIEMGSLRKQVGQLTSALSALGEQFNVMAGAFQEGLQALAATAGAIEAQDAGNARQTAELKSLLVAQQRQQTELTASLVTGRERIASQLDQLARLEDVFQENLNKLARASEELAQGFGSTLCGQFARLNGQIAELAAAEAANGKALQPELENILTGEKNLEQVLHSVDGNLGRIVLRSEQVLALHQQEQRRAATREASQLNSAGLKCLGEGNLEGARGFFERARELAPDSFEPAFNLAVARLRAQDTQGALTLIAELEERHPDRKELGLLRGASSLSRGDLQSARDCLERATLAEAGPRNPAEAAALAAMVKAHSGATGAAAAFLRTVEEQSAPPEEIART